MKTVKTITKSAPKRSFTLLHKDGTTPLVARIPEELSVDVALQELASYAGYAKEPEVSTRYALLAAPKTEDGGFGDFVVVRDEQCFSELAENSLLRIAVQPRPAATRSC